MIYVKVFDKLDRYLTDREYKIIYKDKYLNVINYVEILDFNEKEIDIKNDFGITRVLGSNLVISKMLDDEMVIVGDIEKIEL